MKRILLVDDDHSVLRLVQRTLSGAGFAVVAFSSGQEARAALHREHFDLLITDLYMPDVDGFELLMSARAARSFLPAIVMSGEHEPLRMLRSATSLGAVQILWKPFATRPLVDTVAAIIGDPSPAKPSHSSLESEKPESAS